MEINLVGLDGEVRATALVNAADAVAELFKALPTPSIAEAKTISYRLSFANRVLLPSESLQECGLHNGAAVSVVTVPREAVDLNLSHFDHFQFASKELARHMDSGLLLWQLDLGNCGLNSDMGGAAAAGFAAKSCCLRSLQLFGNVDLGASGVLELARILQSNGSSLQMLNLGYCNLAGETGGKAVAAMMRAAPGVTALVLFGNAQFGISGLTAMSEDWPDGGWSQADDISPRSSSLEGKDLCFCQQNGCTLATLDLGFCGLRAVSGTCVAEVVSNIAPKLESLCLSGHRHLGAEGLVALAQSLKLPCLKELELEGCGLQGVEGGKAAALFAQRAPSLRVLSLSDNTELRAEGLSAFLDCIPQPTALDELHLARCGLSGEEGGRALASLMCKVSSLNELGLLGNDELASVGLQSLVEAMPSSVQLKEIDLCQCLPTGVSGTQLLVQIISRCQSLQVLDLASNGSALGARGVEELSRGLQGAMTLKALHLGDCNLTGAAGGASLCRLLAHLPALEELGLVCNTDFGEEGLLAMSEGLTASKELRSLGLENCGLRGEAGGKAAAAVVHVVPGLEGLGLSNNEALTAAGVLAFAVNLPPEPALQKLELEECSLEGLEGGAAILSVVQAAPHIKHLGLCKNHDLKSVGLCSFLEKLPSTSMLSSLHFGDCGLQASDSMKPLASCLSKLLSP
mmetsp:Transcript_157002/g.273380  ORF Transcript_157002/g.273380 Transcript_157002/m.273380 type:complete len:687 (-) Transcript_157002:70-2130(-)